MAKHAHKDYVEIQSSLNIRVEPGLYYEDATKRDSDIPNRLKIIERHSKYGVLIKAGKGVYPYDVCEWPVVKAYIAAGKMTIGNELDSTDSLEALKLKPVIDEFKTTVLVDEETPLDKLSKEE